MNRRLFVLCLLILSLIAMPAFAATNARTATIANGINQVVGVADLSTGNTQEVDTDGSAQVQGEPLSYSFERGDSDAELSGACVIHGLVVQAPTAGDYVLVYDALTATGDPVFDIKIGVNDSIETVSLPQGGVTFSTGVTLDATDDDVTTTLIYEQ